MLKNRHTISSLKVSKRPLRPASSHTLQNKPNRQSQQITNIISSLERNVKDLKTYYHNRQERQPSSSLTKNKNNIRVKKVLKRSGSQLQLRPLSQQHTQRDRGVSCEPVRSYFLKVHGRETNNIVELYEFYKKNMEKRQKSTRILASIDLSNPNMGLSLDVGKQSIIRPEILREPNQIKEQQQNQKIMAEDKYQYSSKWENSSNTHKNSKIQEKPSTLAADLLSKGLYNIANVANLMLNKKYKLTKEKEQSFQQALQQKNKLKKEKERISANQNNSNAINIEQCKMIKESPSKVKEQRKVKEQVKEVVEKQKNVMEKSKELSSNRLDQNYSFNDSGRVSIHNSSSKKSKKHQNQSIQPFDPSSIKKLAFESPKVTQMSGIGLQESPIVPNKGGQFIKSKYYVQPIPAPNKRKQQDKSISLQSNSKIIDMDMLPFDL